ncbi:hypothetical protein SteCoe_23521 [Stentor coeruleus]|uniref:Sfi1 spindle body domain-containing protein n=1 Tax=Stentor coeruleus TaxID=5963 RepID=A0A1R2BJN1_9CILI|nr:hypothetical protein SteCoe_23521 [Stentor coeruleus]
MDEKYTIEELYPHLFLNDPRSMVSAMLKVDEEASRIKSRAFNREEPPSRPLTIEEKQAIAFQCIENSRKQEREKAKLDQARSRQQKILREYDPRVGIEERHLKVQEKRDMRKNKATAEECLEQLRAERQRLMEEINPEELEKVRAEVKKAAEEAKQKDLMQRKKIKELQDKEKVAKQKEMLMIEMEKKQRALIAHRIGVLVKACNVVVVGKRKEMIVYAFAKVNDYSMTLKANTLKISRKYRFKRIMRFFHLWHSIALKIKLDEETAYYQAEQEKLLYLCQIADKNYEFWLKRKSFEALEKYLVIIQNERQQAQEALNRRKKLEKFMEFVKLRTEENQQLKESEKPIEVVKEKKTHKKEPIEVERLNNIEKTLKELQEKKQNEDLQEKKTNFKQDAATDMDFQYFACETPVPSENAPSNSSQISPSVSQSQNSPRNPSQNIEKTQENSMRNSPNSKKNQKQSREMTQMELRQAERKIKRQQLEAKYKEKKEKEEQEKKEMEIKAIEEEKRKKREILEKRKQEERAKKEIEEKKKKEFEEIKGKMSFAAEFYSKKVVKKMILAWTEYHYNWQRSVIKAEVFGDRALKKIFWNLLIQGVNVIKEENRQIEIKRLQWAYGQYCHRLKKRYFNKFIDFYDTRIEREQEIFKQRPRFLIKTVFAKWVDIIPELLDERYEREKEENEIVARFRFNFMVPKVMQGWKSFVEEQKEEKLKEMFTQSMWEKAQLWLAEESNNS